MNLHTMAVVDPAGQLLFIRDGVLTAQSFDLRRFVLSGSPIAIVDRAMHDLANGGGAFSLSSDGTLAYLPGGSIGSSRLQAFDRAGNPGAFASDGELETDPELSPDETRLAITRLTPRGDRDIWVVDLARGTATPLRQGLTPK